MIEIVVGSKFKPAAIDSLISELIQIPQINGTLYVGYPILTIGTEPLKVDAALISEQHGVVVFDLLTHPAGAPQNDSFWSELDERQTQIDLALQSKLIVHPALTERRKLKIDINIVIYAHAKLTCPPGFEFLIAWPGELASALTGLGAPVAERYSALNAAIQAVSTIKPRKKRPQVTTTASRGGIIREVEREIANLDRFQKRAAIETPEGPQRIRGLAGSGKTVVLALKAAYLHTQHPDWNIVITFQTRSLYQQFKDLVRRFCFEHIGDEPDWTRLKILHAWGSSRGAGVYSDIAQYHGVAPRDFTSAKSQYGRDAAFQGICDELLQHVKNTPRPPLFDAVLIDEAQDQPSSFFRLVYSAVKEPKRIVWAYDELQNLGAFTMHPADELFGHDDSGQPLVTLRNIEQQPHQDVILPVCYRNTPWALATAHALGFGVYRKTGLVQFFEEPALWRDVGYETKGGQMVASQEVCLARSANSYPSFFDRLLKPDDAVLWKVFPTAVDQAEWIASEISRHVSKEELDLSDILVIYPDPITVTESAAPLMAALSRREISAHIAGITHSRDEFFQDASVAISGIYRAKGNEAPMVFVADGQYCFSGPNLIRKRNILFTAITRSRAWVRICGYGDHMAALAGEMERVKAEHFQLRFVVPSSDELSRIRRIHRDLTEDERGAISIGNNSLDYVRNQIETGVLAPEDLDPNILESLRKLLDPERSR